MRLGNRLGERLSVAFEVQRLNGYDVPLDGERPKQELGEPSCFLGFRIRPTPLGDVSRDPRECLSGSIHHLVDSGRWGKQPGEITNGQLDAVENIRQRRELA
jgi:hypothetical protein